MRSEVRTSLIAVVASVVLAGLVALLVGLGVAGAAAEESSSGDASSTTSTVSDSSSASDSATSTSSASSSDSDSATSTSSASSSDSASATTTAATAFEVEDAQLRWGINNESNNAAYFAYIFFSAGELPDRGANHTVTSTDWRQSDGEVSIEKYSETSKSYQPATWAGLTALNATSGFSDHQIVWAGGTGSVDPGSGDAVIRWTGSASVVYYSGYSFFFITDPVLTVTDGSAVLTAKLGGYGASRTDSTWVKLSETDVTLADLGTVDLGADGGFTATPAYRGIAITAPEGSAAQDRTGESWGSFPQSYVDFQSGTGIASYWYSSGASVDPNKVALPVTVSYDASKPVAVTAPSSAASPADKVTNKAVAAPTSAAADATTTVTAAAAPLAVPSAPGLPAVGTTSAALPSAHPVDTLAAVQPASAQTGASPLSWPWVAGAAALLLSAFLLSLPAVRSGRRTTHPRRTAHPGA